MQKRWKVVQNNAIIVMNELEIMSYLGDFENKPVIFSNKRRSE